MSQGVDYGPDILTYGDPGNPYADPTVAGSPMWWLRRHWRRMHSRTRAFKLYQNYYDGKHNLAFATDKFKQRFGNLFKNYSDNWCDLIVDATEERLNIEGFRIPTGDDALPRLGKREIPTGDADAWDIWQRNDLDMFAQIGHSMAITRGEAAVMVWADDEGEPLITVEDPFEVIVETAPSSLEVLSAMKRWRDYSDLVFVNIYLPDRVWKFKSDRKLTTGGQVSTDVRWIPRESNEEEWPLSNKLGIVPVVPIFNRPRLMPPGLCGDSEIRQVIPTQDAVNKIIADMLLASEFQSFKQRVITGIEIPRDPKTNEILTDFYKQMLEKVWLFEGDNAKAYELGQVDLGGYVKAVDLTVQHLASRTRTPPHYFFLGGQFPSGETIKSAETGLVKKTLRKQIYLGESWERVIRIAFQVKGDARASVRDMETIWGDPESHRESELADALVKRLDIGVPPQQLWEDAGYTPQQRTRFKEMHEEANKLPILALKPAPAGPPSGGNGHGPEPQRDAAGR